jgi:transcriptional/translational regulatory protein YebC/TACO1
MTMLPSSTVKVVGEDAKALMAMMEALEDHEDVQNVYANFDIPDEVMDKITAS